MANDRAAEEFALRYLEEVRRCVRLAYVLCGDEGTAEDIVGDAFASCWPQFRAGQVDDVHAYLLSLPMDQRSVLVLRFLEDRSELETAEILGVRVGTVKSRTSRGLDQLRARLGGADDD